MYVVSSRLLFVYISWLAIVCASFKMVSRRVSFKNKFSVKLFQNNKGFHSHLHSDRI